MPEISGFDVIKTLKADPRTRQIPVIFVTAKTDVEDEQKGFDLVTVERQCQHTDARNLVQKKI